MSRSGDGEAEFDEFYQWNARKVIHLVYASTGDLTLAQDCTQEAFSRAWQQWSKVSAYDDPLAWVRTVARRLAISAWRKKTNQNRAHVRHGFQASAPGPSEDRVAVMTALSKLSGPVGIIQFAGKSAKKAAEDGNSTKRELRASITTTRQIAMFYKLDLFKYNYHAKAVAEVLGVSDSIIRTCFTDRLAYDASMKGELHVTLQLGTLILR